MLIADASELKSLEGLVDTQANINPPVPLPAYAIVPCGHVPAFSGWPETEGVDKNATGFHGEPPRCIFERDPETGLVMLGWADASHWQVRAAIELFPELVVREAPSFVIDIFEYLDDNGLADDSPAKLRGEGPNDPARWNVMMIPYQALKGPLSTDQRDVLAACVELTVGLTRRGYEISKNYDVVITALGWTYDTGPFNAGGTHLELDDLATWPARPRRGVYPRLTAEHESVTARHAYFVGANAHGLDRARYQASGGFVHGFRFTTRHVFRTLVNRYEAQVRPGVTLFPLPPATSTPAGKTFATLTEIPVWNKLLGRVLFSAASYEMVGGSLVDGVAFCSETGRSTYVEEVPEDIFHSNFSRFRRVTFGFYAGGASDHRHPGVDLSKLIRLPEFAPISQPFHPVLEFWPAGDVGRDLGRPAEGDRNRQHPSAFWQSHRPSSRFHFKADRLTDYSHFANVPLLDSFLRDIADAVHRKRETLSRSYHEHFDLVFNPRFDHG